MNATTTIVFFVIGMLFPIVMYLVSMLWTKVFDFIDVKLRLKKDKEYMDGISHIEKVKKDIMDTYDKYKDEFDIDEPNLDDII